MNSEPLRRDWDMFGNGASRFNNRQTLDLYRAQVAEVHTAVGADFDRLARVRRIEKNNLNHVGAGKRIKFDGIDRSYGGQRQIVGLFVGGEAAQRHNCGKNGNRANAAKVSHSSLRRLDDFINGPHRVTSAARWGDLEENS